MPSLWVQARSELPCQLLAHQACISGTLARNKLVIISGRQELSSRRRPGGRWLRTAHASGQMHINFVLVDDDKTVSSYKARVVSTYGLIGG